MSVNHSSHSRSVHVRKRCGLWAVLSSSSLSSFSFLTRHILELLFPDIFIIILVYCLCSLIPRTNTRYDLVPDNSGCTEDISG